VAENWVLEVAATVVRDGISLSRKWTTSLIRNRWHQKVGLKFVQPQFQGSNNMSRVSLRQALPLGSRRA
jgi:hypothetical protein